MTMLKRLKNYTTIFKMIKMKQLISFFTALLLTAQSTRSQDQGRSTALK